MHIAHREVHVMDGKTVIASLEARYTFTVTAGRKAVTWHNAAEGFSPAEGPTVEIISVETRWHQSSPWRAASGEAFDMLTADVPDAWFLAQIEADEVAA
ncbi:MAG: hypothetical protein RSE12_17170 [Fuscovulum sp.]|nr:MAG: hypothetical protein RSE12_17170 [Fuscovulum sp.]